MKEGNNVIFVCFGKARNENRHPVVREQEALYDFIRRPGRFNYIDEQGAYDE